MKSKRAKKNHFLIETVGWLGVVCILSAYALLGAGLASPRDLWYHGLNLIGGMGIVVDALAAKDYQPAVLNFIWAAIALLAIFQICFYTFA